MIKPNQLNVVFHLHYLFVHPHQIKQGTQHFILPIGKQIQKRNWMCTFSFSPMSVSASHSVPLYFLFAVAFTDRSIYVVAVQRKRVTLYILLCSTPLNYKSRTRSPKANFKEQSMSKFLSLFRDQRVFISHPWVKRIQK